MIESVILKDFKSHEESEYVFSRGLNVILGPNGVGKTSIIEAIGWCVFDYNPLTREQLVKFGKKWASVQVKMSDGAIYSRDTKGNYTVSKGGQEYTGKEDVLSFTREYFNMDNPECMFSDIIGVRQSFQLSQFLQTPRERKNAFDELFGVEAYNNLWKMLQPVVSTIKDEIHSVDVNIANVNGILSNKEVLEDNEKTLGNTVKTLRAKKDDKVDRIKSLTDKKTQLEEMNRIYNSLKDKKKIIIDSEKEISELKVVVDEIEKLVEERKTIFDNTKIQKEIEAQLSEISFQENVMLEYKSKLENIHNDIVDIKVNIEYLEERQKSMKDLEEKAKVLVELEEEFNITKELKIRMTLEEDDILASMEKAKFNICPLSGESCNQDILSVLQKKLSKHTNEFETVMYKFLELEEKCGNAKNASLDYEQLKREVVEISQLKEKMANVVYNRQEMLSKISDIEKIVSKKDELTTKLESLGDPKIRLGHIDEFLGGHKDCPKRLIELEEKIFSLRKEIEYVADDVHKFSPDELLVISEELTLVNSEMKATVELLHERFKDLKSIRETIDGFRSQEKKLQNMEQVKSNLKDELSHIEHIRSVIRSIPDKLVRGRVYRINCNANELYSSVVDTPSTVGLSPDYEIFLEDSKGRRAFSQLSGGEAMTSAICVRVSILRELSKSKFLFLDECTQNLDLPHRLGVAQAISDLKFWEGLDQIFVITHDDSFAPFADNVITLENV